MWAGRVNEGGRNEKGRVCGVAESECGGSVWRVDGAGIGQSIGEM